LHSSWAMPSLLPTVSWLWHVATGQVWDDR
jgi:hypothetical protein